MAKGGDVLLEIDWQGARQVREHFPEAVSILSCPLPISMHWNWTRASLERGQTRSRPLRDCLLGAGAEMAHASEFDFVIINSAFLKMRWMNSAQS